MVEDLNVDADSSSLKLKRKEKLDLRESATQQ
jgi:hypothetical protein